MSVDNLNNRETTKTKTIIKQASLNQAGQEIKEVWQGQSYVIVSDENVWPLYGNVLEKSLQDAGFNGIKIIIKSGEESKSLEAFLSICQRLAKSDVGRDWLMIALGGGVVGDLAGFVASVFKRGMDLVQIPTSLLGQVDSSLGGKTGINLDQGKNLIGSFHQPLLTLIDTSLVESLDGKARAEGMAEIIKYGAAFDRDFFLDLEDSTESKLDDWIIRAGQGKLSVTEKDEKDRGQRRKLNFGHSFGHAIEKMGGYKRFSHGESVALGMCLAVQVGQVLGITEKGTQERLRGLLERFDLPVNLPMTIRAKFPEMLEIMVGDKKNQGDGLTLIFLEEIGSSLVYTIGKDKLLEVLKEIDVLEIDKLPFGPVKLPPSKSLSHRIIIMAALAGNKALLKRLGFYDSDPAREEIFGEDVLATLESMEKLLGWTGPDKILNVKESGSTLRFILPLALALGKEVEIQAGESLLNRPQQTYYDVLEKAGGKIQRQGNSLFVSGKLKPGVFSLPGNISSQYISGLLMAFTVMEGESSIELTSPLESAPYVDMTRQVMKDFDQITEIEGDFSAGAYFLVAGALGCDLECVGLKADSIQGDRKIIDFLKEAGAKVQIKDNGNIKVTAKDLKAIEADVSQCPDLAPPLAVLLSFCQGESKIKGGHRLALKESNRLESIAKALNSLGGDVRIEDGNLVIKGQEAIRGGRANPSGDHRIAMSIALAAVRSRDKVLLENPGCVSKSYPNFFEDFCKEDKK